MKYELIESYLRDMAQALRAKSAFADDLLMELEDHLYEAVEKNIKRGLNHVEAQEEALKRFGSAQIVSSAFTKERNSNMQKILLAIAVSLGMFITYVDSQPTWDDTGITAGVILLTCGLISLIGFKRPWLLALVVGGGIPLYGLFVTQNYASIIALVIAFVGAYAGWAFRLGINKMLRPA